MRNKNDNPSTIIVYLKGKTLTQLNISNLIINEKSSFVIIFSIDKMHVQLFDIIFKYITAEEFKNIGNSVVKILSIINP